MRGPRVRFGSYEVSLRAGELRKHGTKIKLQDQPFLVLAMLLERPGEIVTREELQQKLWPSDTFVNFDIGLNTAVKRLRDALSDSADTPRYVETVPRKGYRFIAAAEFVEDSAKREEPAPNAPVEVVAPRRLGRFWFVFGLVVATLALVLGLNVGRLRQRFLRKDAAPKVRSIAVLPLVNLSGDPKQDYLADGMTEALITDLGKIGHLRVISRTSVMRYKGTKKPLPEIAQELQVDALVEGTVARDGDHVRITANLVQASPEKHLWADRFERDIGDVLSMQDDVSRAIASSIQIRLTPQEQARFSGIHQVNPEAYEAYLEGRYFTRRFLPLQPDSDVKYFELAIQKDPGWALPYSGLAEDYLISGVNDAIPNEDCRKAKTLALESVNRDNAAAEGHAILAEVEFSCEWNWLDAEKEAKHAIELNPSNARAHGSRGLFLLTMGRTDEALDETKRAVELDPVDFPVRWDRWTVLYMAGRYDEAAEQGRKMQELGLVEDLGHIYCGAAYIQQGKLTGGIQELEKAVAIVKGSNLRGIGYLGYAYAVANRKKDAESMLAKLLEAPKDAYVHPELVAGVYAGLGQKQAAFKWLEKAYRVRDMYMLEVKYDPRFANLHSDPRFIELVRRIGVPP